MYCKVFYEIEKAKFNCTAPNVSSFLLHTLVHLMIYVQSSGSANRLIPNIMEIIIVLSTDEDYWNGISRWCRGNGILVLHTPSM